MRCLLDTNVIVPFLSGRRPHVIAAVRQRSLEELCLSSLVIHELFFGAYKSSRVPHSVASVNELPFAVLPFDYEDAAEAGRVRAALAAQGQSIGPYDVLIAGQALRRGLTVVRRMCASFGASGACV